MKSRQLFFTLILIQFASFAKAQDTGLNPTTDDFCTSINKVMQYSFDNFASIKEAEQKTKIGFYSEYFWMSKYQLAGFSENVIKLTITNKGYFSATYFRDADLLKALAKYNELIEMVKACVPKTCCDFSESVSKDMDDIKRFEFWTGQAKTGSDKRFEKAFISVNYLVETASRQAVVFLCVAPKE